MSDAAMVFRAGPGARWTGVYFFGNGRQSFWHLTCPCGVTSEYPVNGLPEVDTPHPCGNSDHWTVRYEPEAAAAATPSARCVVVPREPTLDMMYEGAIKIQDWDDAGGSQTNAAREVYKAMLAPAAQPNAELGTICPTCKEYVVKPLDERGDSHK